MKNNLIVKLNKSEFYLDLKRIIFIKVIINCIVSMEM